MKRILIGLLLAVACVNLAWADGELGLALDALNNPEGAACAGGVAPWRLA
ncbi:MAG: hypothetical protein L6U16_07440 [Porphyromonadaceae bacterium]|nr:MAG: hypothetical protein L6U16_07440 [Porphyromonadaceae bacterium]